MAQRVVVVALGVLGLLCTACGSDVGVESPLSQDQALAQARRNLVLAAESAVGPDARIVPDGGPRNPAVDHCSDSYHPPRGTAVVGTYYYRAIGRRAATRAVYVRRVQRTLAGQGWKQVSNDEFGVGFRRHHFGLRVRPGTRGTEVTVVSQTPCVKPKDLDDPLGESG